MKLMEANSIQMEKWHNKTYEEVYKPEQHKNNKN